MGIELYNGSVATNIKCIMLEKGLKQAGFNEKEFSAMLKNRKIIKVDDVMDIAKALGVSPNELFGIKEPQQPTA